MRRKQDRLTSRAIAERSHNQAALGSDRGGFVRKTLGRCRIARAPISRCAMPPTARPRERSRTARRCAPAGCVAARAVLALIRRTARETQVSATARAIERVRRGRREHLLGRAGCAMTRRPDVPCRCGHHSCRSMPSWSSCPAVSDRAVRNRPPDGHVEVVDGAERTRRTRVHLREPGRDDDGVARVHPLILAFSRAKPTPETEKTRQNARVRRIAM